MTSSTVHPYVCPPLHVCQCDHNHASLQQVTAASQPTTVKWPFDTCQNEVSADQYHATISRAEAYSSPWSAVFFFFKLTADQVLVFDWFAGSTQVNSPKHKQGFIFLMLSVARRGYTVILCQLQFLHSQHFLCSGGKQFGKCFISAFFTGFNPV